MRSYVDVILTHIQLFLSHENLGWQHECIDQSAPEQKCEGKQDYLPIAEKNGQL